MVNVEKLLKMVKNGEMLKNVGENIKTNFMHWSSFTFWILKILFLTQHFFAISNYDQFGQSTPFLQGFVRVHNYV